MVKDPFSAIFWALNFVDLVNINFLKVQNSSKSKFRDAQSVQMADFDTLDLAILISRKIWLRKFMKFPNCEYSLVPNHLRSCPYFPCLIVPSFKVLRPILGSGLWTDPFWAVDSTQFTWNGCRQSTRLLTSGGSSSGLCNKSMRACPSLL